MQDSGVSICAVGIGSGIKEDELKQIAGNRGSYMKVPNFDSLSEKLNELLVDVCGKCKP